MPKDIALNLRGPGEENLQPQRNILTDRVKSVTTLLRYDAGTYFVYGSS
jgi:hypothetical protein